MASPEFAKTHPGTLKELASLPLISDSHSYWQTLLASHNLPKPSRLLQFNQDVYKRQKLGDPARKSTTTSKISPAVQRTSLSCACGGA